MAETQTLTRAERSARNRAAWARRNARMDAQAKAAQEQGRADKAARREANRAAWWRMRHGVIAPGQEVKADDLPHVSARSVERVDGDVWDVKTTSDRPVRVQRSYEVIDGRTGEQTNERVRYASTAEHFRRANLDNKNARWIVFLETGHDKRGFRSMAPYLMRNCDGKPYILFGSAYLDSYSCAPCDPFGYDSDIWHALQNGSAAMLSDQGKAELLYACKTEQKRLEKRINAYLKRYGTSKIHVWTYWTEA